MANIWTCLQNTADASADGEINHDGRSISTQVLLDLSTGSNWRPPCKWLRFQERLRRKFSWTVSKIILQPFAEIKLNSPPRPPPPPPPAPLFKSDSSHPLCATLLTTPMFWQTTFAQHRLKNMETRRGCYVNVFQCLGFFCGELARFSSFFKLARSPRDDAGASLLKQDAAKSRQKKNKKKQTINAKLFYQSET